MPVKRSRNEMSKAATSSTQQQQQQQTVKKHVHFGTAPPVVIPSQDDEDATTAQEPQPLQACEHELWYTRQELQQQSFTSSVVIQQWLSQGYGILLEHSYQQPHIQTQEYLHAFAALSSGDNHQDEQEQECLRGLELALVGLDHARERSIARKRHRQAVLRMQRLLLGHPSHQRSQSQQYRSMDALFADHNAKSNDDKLATCSRQGSAAAKLFAMRMGRADAKVVEQGDDASLAAEIVQRHWKRNSNKSPSSSQSTSPSASYTNLASLICLESPSKRGHAKPGMVTLPIQDVVYGRCCRPSNSPTIATTSPTALVVVASTSISTPTTILT